jgi:putative ABC transport system permease protein
MNVIEIISTALRSLFANRMRAFLTMLGIIIGVAAVIALMGVGQGASAAITSQIQSLGTNLLFVSPGSSSTNGVRSATGSAVTLTLDDAYALANPDACPSVALVAPEVDNFAQLAAGGQNANARFYGVTEEYAAVRNLTVVVGDFISNQQVTAQSTVAVLGATTAKDLFPNNDDPVGETVYVNSVPLRVIGVLASKGGNGMGSSDEGVYVPITTAQSRLSGGRYFRGGKVISSINIQVVSAKAMQSATEEIAAVLRSRHNIIYDDDFTITSQESMLSTMTQVTSILTVFLSAIAAISLLVGGIGIMNIMLVSVTERTREIGIRKAVGAKRRDVLTQFLAEALLLSLTGGLVGVLAGAGIAKLISGVSIGSTTLNPVVLPSSVLLAVLFSAAVGLFFGVYPAWRAAQLRPIEALRYE